MESQSVIELPEEIVENILLSSRFPDVLNLCRTSDIFYRICNSDNFWMRKYYHDFGNLLFTSGDEDESKTWYNRYSITANILDQLNDIKINDQGLVAWIIEIQNSLKSHNKDIIDDHMDDLREAPDYVLINRTYNFKNPNLFQKFDRKSNFGTWVGPYSPGMYHYYKYEIEPDSFVHLLRGSGLTSDEQLEPIIFDKKVVINSDSNLLHILFTLDEFLSLDFNKLPYYYPIFNMTQDLIEDTVQIYNQIKVSTKKEFPYYKIVREKLINQLLNIPILRFKLELISYLVRNDIIDLNKLLS